ncbi:RloB family protein [Bifidobacterium amazonense]|uniref:RloB family protein n=1 Tax=Bifidobacterium amazonense TaxID=2809027 RepID=A0ABS9VXL3_9BIFI|nr:RloB family protein [Bifidobacterium amazonense]
MTEVEYINAIKRLPSIAERFHIEIDDLHGAPRNLMDKAINVLRGNQEINQCWCVFDVEWPASHPHDHHPYLQDVIRRSDQYEHIRCAISNPTFEFWLILHHKYENRFLLNEDAEKERHQLDGSIDKSLFGKKSGDIYDAEWYALHCEIACKNAVKLDQWRALSASFPNNNPSSTMTSFIKELGLYNQD